MADKTKKTGLNWLNSLNLSKNDSEQNTTNEIEKETEISDDEIFDDAKESEKELVQKEVSLLSKDNQDKLVLDLLVSLENLLKDRQLTAYKNKNIDTQLLASNSTINTLKQDLSKNSQLLIEKNEQIENLEESLTYKQMAYDQLLEDYKDHQINTSTNYDNISLQLNSEISKYNTLSEEYTNYKKDAILKISKLEEAIRNHEIEKSQYEMNYKKVSDEKNELMKTISDFTDRMSFSFSPKINSDQSDPK